MIPDNYVKLELPNTMMQILGNSPLSERGPQMDAHFYIATM